LIPTGSTSTSRLVVLTRSIFPTEGEVLSAEGEVVSIEGEVLSTEGQVLPTDGRYCQQKGSSQGNFSKAFCTTCNAKNLPRTRQMHGAAVRPGRMSLLTVSLVVVIASDVDHDAPR